MSVVDAWKTKELKNSLKMTASLVNLIKFHRCHSRQLPDQTVCGKNHRKDLHKTQLLLLYGLYNVFKKVNVQPIYHLLIVTSILIIDKIKTT